MTPRLCGGTFLTLLSQVRQELPYQRIRFADQEYTASDKCVLLALLRMMNPEHEVNNPETVNGLYSKFKLCVRTYNKEVPLKEARYSAAYHRRFTCRDPELYASMSAFIDAFLRTNEKEQMDWLGNALMETIALDPYTDRNPFWPTVAGGFVSKTALLTETVISLPLLLAAVWDYCATYVEDNTVGQETVLGWTESKSTPNDRGAIKADVGESVRGRYTFLLNIPGGQEAAGRVQAKERAAAPQAPVMAQSAYGADYPIQGVGQPVNGATVYEMLGLKTDYYSLIVVDGETLSDPFFTLPYSCLFIEGTDEQDCEWLRKMKPATIELLTSIPTVFAPQQPLNGPPPIQAPALLGRITDIKRREYDVRIAWKPYKPFPVNVLLDHRTDFGIYYSSLSTELEVQHWAVKPDPLYEKLIEHGVHL